MLAEKLRRWLRPKRKSSSRPTSLGLGEVDDEVNETKSLHGEFRSHAPASSHRIVERGHRLGRYLILEAIGAGGTANVYAAYDEQLERRVALKILRFDPQHGACDPDQLLLEAKAAARLAHPNVITVFDVGRVEGLPFVAMELVEGQTLDDWAISSRRSWKETLDVLVAAGRGLAAAHQSGLVHRDFKASNVMVSGDGRVLVLDFGLALDSPTASPSTAGSSPETRERGRVAGTPFYMAPEQLRGALGDEFSDQFSFCVTAWKMFYGHLPWNARERIEADLDPTPSPTGGRRVPAAVRKLLARGLTGDPTERHPSLEALLDALQAVKRRGLQIQLAAAALVGLTVVTSAGAFFGIQHGEVEVLCDASGERLAGIWDDQIAGTAGKRFATLGAEAATTWERVEGRLNAYSRHWVQIHRDACRATHLRGEQSPHMLDLQTACLDTRRQELATATEILQSAGPEMIHQAVALTESLSRLAPCADRPALLAQPAPPTDPKLAARADEVQSLIAAAKVFEAAGRYREAIAQGEVANLRATQIDHPPLRADALLRLAQSKGRVGRYVEMKQHLISAAELAQGVGYDRATGLAFSALVLASMQTGDLDEATTWSRMAAGIVARTGDQSELAAMHQLFLGLLAEAQGRYEEAIDHQLSYLEFSAAGFHSIPRSVSRGWARLYLGRLYGQLEQFDRADAELRLALELFTEAVGPRHRTVVKTLTILGTLRERQGDPEGASELFQQALSTLDQVGEEDDWDTADVLDGLGSSLLKLDRPPAAVEALERSFEIRRNRPGRPVELARTHFLLAQALWREGATTQAYGLALEGRASLADETPATEHLITEMDRWLTQRDPRSGAK